MLLSDFDYILPKELIAQTPIEPRDHSKLLILSKKSCVIEDAHFYDIYSELGENDILVVNETKVIPARLTGKIETYEKETEVFLHKQMTFDTYDCLVHPGKKFKVGTKVSFGKTGGVFHGEVLSLSESGRIIRFNKGGIDLLKALEQVGETPLPPYIKEKSSPERYQTVYSKHSGSVAAPTAGLHFTQELLKRLEKKGVIVEKVTLHVGLGTFKGVDVEDITKHQMHSEWCSIDKETAQRLTFFKKSGKRIIAVGTTSVRTLESFSDNLGRMGHGEKETQIFIYPGYSWKFVDAIITNFHLPKSTLLMLVSSFAGSENIKKAYSHAIQHKYRFFSFGDAMFLKN